MWKRIRRDEFDRSSNTRMPCGLISTYLRDGTRPIVGKILRLVSWCKIYIYVLCLRKYSIGYYIQAWVRLIVLLVKVFPVHSYLFLSFSYCALTLITIRFLTTARRVEFSALVTFVCGIDPFNKELVEECRVFFSNQFIFDRNDKVSWIKVNKWLKQFLKR